MADRYSIDTSGTYALPVRLVDNETGEITYFKFVVDAAKARQLLIGQDSRRRDDPPVAFSASPTLTW